MSSLPHPSSGSVAFSSTGSRLRHLSSDYSDESRIFAPSFRVKAEEEDCYQISSLPLCASSSISQPQHASSCLTTSGMTAGGASSSSTTAAAVVSAAATFTAALSSTTCPPLSPAFELPPDSLLYNPPVIPKSALVSSSKTPSQQQQQVPGSGYCSICAPFSNPIFCSDHRVCMISLNKSTFAQLPAETIRTLCSGTYALHLEEETGRSAIVFLMLEQSLGTMLWCRGTSSGLKSTFSSNHRDTPSPGRSYHTLSSSSSTRKNLVTKEMQDRLLHLMISRFEHREIYSTGLEEGFIDLMRTKEACLSETKIDLSLICRKSGIKSHDIDPRSCMRLVFGSCLSDNRSLQFILPKDSSALWSKGITSLLRLLHQQSLLSDKRLTWLKYKYLQLYYNSVNPCTHPTPADAIKSFGGRKWTLSGLEISSSGAASAAADDGKKNVAASCYSSPAKSSSHRPSFLSARNSLTAVSLFSTTNPSVCKMTAPAAAATSKKSLLQKKKSTPSFTDDDDWSGSHALATSFHVPDAKSKEPEFTVTEKPFHRRSLRFSLRKVSSRHSFSLFSPFRSRRESSFSPSAEDTVSSSSSASNASAGMLHMHRAGSMLDDAINDSDSSRKLMQARTCDSPAVQKRIRGWFGSQKNLADHKQQHQNPIPSDPGSLTTGSGMKVKTSIAHSSQVNFFEFTELYRSFMIRSRPDIKQLFDKLSQHGNKPTLSGAVASSGETDSDPITSPASFLQQQSGVQGVSRDAADTTTAVATKSPLTTIITTTSAALSATRISEHEENGGEEVGQRKERIQDSSISALSTDPVISKMTAYSASFKKVNLPAKRRDPAVHSGDLNPLRDRSGNSVHECSPSSVNKSPSSGPMHPAAISFPMSSSSTCAPLTSASLTSTVTCLNRTDFTPGKTLSSSSDVLLTSNTSSFRVPSSLSTAAVCQSAATAHTSTPLDLHERRKSLSIASASGSASSTTIDQRSDAGIKSRRGSLFTVARDTLIAAATRRDVKSDDHASSHGKGMSNSKWIMQQQQQQQHKHRQAVTRGLLTRNASPVTSSKVAEETEEKSRQRSLIWDAIASASIVSNSTGIESRSRCDVLSFDQFSYFIHAYQKEDLSEDQIRDLLQKHEPDTKLCQQQEMSFDGFACYLLDKVNFAFTPEQNTYIEDEMDEPLSHYYMATSHNTYLTGHQLKGESSVELYSNVLRTGCRCVELDCWDGEDGFPVIYHGHTLTSKILFRKVIQAINDSAFQTSPFPVILSLENHCSLPQQSRMAQIFVSIFGDKLVTRFMFESDFLEQPRLPTPNQLKYKILIKNKKLRVSILPAIQHRFKNIVKGTQSSPGSNIASPGPSASTSIILSSATTGQHATADRTNSLLSVASSESLNDEDDESDDEEDVDDEMQIPSSSMTPVKQPSSSSSLVQQFSKMPAASAAVLRTESSSSQERVPCSSDSPQESGSAILSKQQLHHSTPQIQELAIHQVQNRPLQQQQEHQQQRTVLIEVAKSQGKEKHTKAQQQLQQQQLYVQLQHQQQKQRQQSVQIAREVNSGRKSSQVAPDLSDLVNYVQAVKFRGLFLDVRSGLITTSPTSGSIHVMQQQQQQQPPTPTLQMNQLIQQSYHHQHASAAGRQSTVSTISLPVSKKSSASSRKASAGIVTAAAPASTVSLTSSSPAHEIISSATTIRSSVIANPASCCPTVGASIDAARNAASASSATSVLIDSGETGTERISQTGIDVSSSSLTTAAAAAGASRGDGSAADAPDSVSFITTQVSASLASSSAAETSYLASSEGISDEVVGGGEERRGRDEINLNQVKKKKMQQEQEEEEMMHSRTQEPASSDPPAVFSFDHASSPQFISSFPAASNLLPTPTSSTTASATQIQSSDHQPVLQLNSPDSPDHEERWANPAAACYQVPSLNEYTAKKLCRKTPLAVISFTASQLMRSYPAGMRIDSSNFNPITFWAFGLQMAAINYQTDDIGNAINAALFEQNGCIGLIRKPAVMINHHHVMHGRFNPWEKEFDGLCAIDLMITVISGQYVCPDSNTGSPQVELELIGIPVDCNKQRSRIVQRNSLNPIFNDTFAFRVTFSDLAFIRFAVIDTSSNHVTSQRIIPINCLKPGYRHIPLRSPANASLPVSSLFIHSCSQEEGIEILPGTDPSGTADEMTSGTQSLAPDPYASSIAASQRDVTASAPTRRRMFFLVVHGVVAEEPSTILKITQDSTTSEVIEQALIKGNKSSEKVYDYVLIEEVAPTWDKKRLGKDGSKCSSVQRILDADERPLQAQSRWTGEGRFVLKKVSDDPSTRAWMSTIKAATMRKEKILKHQESEGRDEFSSWNDDLIENFLVCVYNVSPDQPYTILKASTTSTAQEIIQRALLKARRIEDSKHYVIMEEVECDSVDEGSQSSGSQQHSQHQRNHRHHHHHGRHRHDHQQHCSKSGSGTGRGVGGGSSSCCSSGSCSNVCRKRMIGDEEVLYLAQSSWRSKGLFRMLARSEAQSILEQRSKPRSLLKWTQSAKGSLRRLSRMSSFTRSKESSTDRDSSG